MGDELNKEEQEAADKLAKEAAEEKTTLSGISDQLSGVEDMLKSQTKKEEDPADPPEDEIDFEKIKENPEELAKAFTDDPEGQKDFIKKFSDACGIHPRDMYDETGEQLIDEEMAKAMEEAEEKGERILNSILGAIQETNERTTVMNSVNTQILSMLAKSVSGMNGVMEEMQKSMVKTETAPEKKPTEEGNELPNLDDAAGDPLSKESLEKSVDPEIAKEKFQKSVGIVFNDQFASTDDQVKYEDLMDKSEKLPVETILGLMQRTDRERIETEMSCLV